LLKTRDVFEVSCGDATEPGWPSGGAMRFKDTDAVKVLEMLPASAEAKLSLASRWEMSSCLLEYHVHIRDVENVCRA
jgi:hypothetical protein